MDPIDVLLRLVLLPGVVCAAAAGLARTAFPRSPRARGALVAAGLAAGFVTALAAMGVRPSLPLAPSDPAWTWVVWLAAAGALLGAAESARALPLPGAIGARGAAGAVATWLLLRPLVPHAMSPATLWGGVAIGALLVALVWTAIGSAARRDGRVALGGPVLLASSALSVVLLVHGRSAVMAQAAGAMAASLGVTAALRWRSGGALLPEAAAPVVALSLVGLAAGGFGYLNYGATVRFPLDAALLLVLAAATPLARRASVAIPLAVVLTGAGAFLAWLRDAPSPGPW